MSDATDVFVAVHAGAGNHSESNEHLYKSVCKLACQQAMMLLRSRRSALEAVTAAVVVLENDECTNAGRGSNLTMQGTVECDASVMDGQSLMFGAVGALSGVANPVSVASRLVEEQKLGPLACGRVRPSILVGKGAQIYCSEKGFEVNTNLISATALKTYIRYKRRCQSAESGESVRKRRRLETQETNHAGSGSETQNLFPTVGDGVQDTVGDGVQDKGGDGVQDTGGDGVQDTGGDGVQDTGGDGVQDTGGDGVQDPGGDGVQDTGGDGVQDTGGDGVQDTGGDGVQDTGGDGVQDTGGDGVQDTVGDGVQDTGGDGVQDTGGDGVQDTGGDGVQDTGGDGVQDTGDDGVQDTVGDGVQDTVGAVCVDYDGNVAAATSSGGIWLKHSGRLGPASIYGAGCWAQNQLSQSMPAVASVTSGCGEDLIQTVFAKTCSDAIRSAADLSQSLAKSFQLSFLDSEFLASKGEKFGGALILRSSRTNSSKEVELSWIHSTASLCLAYMAGNKKSPTTVMSRLAETCTPGQTFTMGGHMTLL